jgi:hypothetical protein
VARRLLLTLGNFSGRVTHWLGCKDMPNAMTGAFVNYPNVEGLEWRNRLRQWTRWTVPIQKTAGYQVEPLEPTEFANPGDQDPPSPSTNQGNENSESPNAEQTVADPSSGANRERSQGSTYWSDKYFTSSSTLVGHVLHSHANERSAQAKKLLDNNNDALHAFSTQVPNLTQILASATLLRPEPIESLILRFLPNPLQPSASDNKPIGPAALNAFPPVEMRFDIDPDTSKAKFRETRAVVQEERTDLMLPYQAVDLRFLQKTTSRLRRSFIPQIKDFLDKSDLSLMGGQLETPAKILLPISRHLCRDQGFQLLLGKQETGQEIAEVEYLFTGLEIRSTIALEFRGWRLLYTSIEAGKADGRRSELSLRPITVWSEKVKKTEKDFIKAGYELAERLTDPQALITPRKVNVRKDEPVNRFVRLGRKREHKGVDLKYFARSLGIRTVPVRSDEERARAWGHGLDNAKEDAVEQQEGDQDDGDWYE